MKDHGLLDQQALVNSYLNKGPRPLSSFSFVSLFAWCDFFEFELLMIDGLLCIFARAETGVFLYLPPLGGVPGPSTLDRVFMRMAHGGVPRAVNRVENIPENLLSAFGQGSYNLYSKAAEYVYRKEDLIALKGNAYKSQRHDCNYFEARHAACSFEPYTDADLDACGGLYTRWAEHRTRSHDDAVYQSMLQENQQVHMRLLTHAKPLGLVTRVLKTGGKIIGYTFGYALDASTFCVYAEIADLAVQGSAAYLFKSFCADPQLAGFSRINTMDDFAMPNIARAKQAYHPSELIASHTASLRTGK